MTRKEKIIETALQLFTTNGIANTPTIQIAKKAMVSEALIFRHFSSKNGLLQSCLHSRKEETTELLSFITQINDPKNRLHYIIQLSSYNESSHQDSTWNMLISLHKETPLLNQQFFDPFLTILESTFQELRYKHPSDEAALLLLILTSLRPIQNQKDTASIQKFLLIKYNLKM